MILCSYDEFKKGDLQSYNFLDQLKPLAIFQGTAAFNINSII